MTLLNSKKSNCKRYVFGFLDETGLLCSPVTDQLFGLGVIIMHHPSSIQRSIINYKNSREYYKEFKFSEINSANLGLYKGLIDLFFKCTNIRFHCILYDKSQLKEDGRLSASFDKTYNSLAAQLISSSLNSDEYVAILADDVNTREENNFEQQIKKEVKENLRRNALFGICRLESHAASIIQLTDVMLGSVAYSCKIKYGLVKKPKSAKLEIIKYLQKKMDIGRLSENVHRNMRFGVKFHADEYFVRSNNLPNKK